MAKAVGFPAQDVDEAFKQLAAAGFVQADPPITPQVRPDEARQKTAPPIPSKTKSVERLYSVSGIGRTILMQDLGREVFSRPPR